MTLPRNTIYRSTVFAEKDYTTFEWILQDYSSLEEFYGRGINSQYFEIADSNKKCLLQYFQTKQEVYVDVLFPHGVHFHTLKIEVSIIDEFGKAVKSVKKIVTEPLPTTWEASYSKICAEPLINAREILTTKGCLCNDTLTLRCKITIIKDVKETLPVAVPPVPCLSDKAHNRFKDLLEKRSLCDVVFLVKHKEFHGHKVVLAASSSIFEAMFNTEANKVPKCTITIDDIKADIFDAFLKYIYTGSIPNMEKQVRDLFVVADKYKVQSLQKTCEDYMKNNLLCANCIEYLIFAHIYGLKNLKEKALELVRNAGKALPEFQKFNTLCNYPNLMIDVLLKIRS